MTGLAAIDLESTGRSVYFHLRRTILGPTTPKVRLDLIDSDDERRLEAPYCGWLAVQNDERRRGEAQFHTGCNGRRQTHPP